MPLLGDPLLLFFVMEYNITSKLQLYKTPFISSFSHKNVENKQVTVRRVVPNLSNINIINVSMSHTLSNNTH